MDDFGMKDSGKRTIFEGKAMREVIEGKGRYDLISPFAIKRLAIVMEKGAVKYDDRNWEKGGIKFGRYIESLKRHINQFEMGMEDEDHLGQAMFNLMALLHFDELGDFTDDNLPKYLKNKKVEKNAEEKIEKVEEITIEEIKFENYTLINNHSEDHTALVRNNRFEEELEHALILENKVKMIEETTTGNILNLQTEKQIELELKANKKNKKIENNDETGDW